MYLKKFRVLILLSFAGASTLLLAKVWTGGNGRHEDVNGYEEITEDSHKRHVISCKMTELNLKNDPRAFNFNQKYEREARQAVDVKRVLEVPVTGRRNRLLEYYDNMRSSYQLSQLSTGNRKKILLWTPFFGDAAYRFGLGYGPFQTQCPVSNCETTNRREDLNISDAVIIHIEERNMTLPGWRHFDQRWIFFLAESPQNTKKVENLETLNGIFNWTITYRQDSDIVFNYGIVKRNKNQKMHKFTEAEFQRKTRMVAWFASNCNTSSKREAYIAELSKYIQVDIYGKCGHLSCPPKQKQCDELLDKTYKFYLAFENSLCKDYITEKFFQALKRKVVPIVMGDFNYSSIAPPMSYIHMAEFNSPKELAKKLLTVGNDYKKYKKYVDWKNGYSIPDENYKAKFVRTFCELCKKLNSRKEDRKVYNDIQRWWIDQANCRTGQTQFY